MNDHDAIEAINEVFDKYCDGELRDVATLGRIGRILGLNINHHREAKKVSA